MALNARPEEEIMCSRYEVNATAEKHVTLRFDISSVPEFAPMPEVRPTNRVPVIKPGGQVEMLRWGLENIWDNKPLINARSETLAEKKTFIPLLENRCLVPATAYFEWRKAGKQKFKTHISLKDQDLFAFAGLYSEDRFTIITCAPSPAIAHIHGRMPAILEEHNEQDWLALEFPFEEVSSVLASYPDDAFEAQELAPPPPPQADLFS